MSNSKTIETSEPSRNFAQDFTDFIYYLEIELMTSAHSLQHIFTKLFRERILLQRDVTISTRFDEPMAQTAKTSIYQQVAVTSNGRKNQTTTAVKVPDLSNSFEPLNSEFEFQLGRNFIYEQREKEKHKESENKNNQQPRYNNWSLCLRCTPKHKKYLYQHCYLHILVHCNDKTAPLTDLAKARLEYLQCNLITLKKVTVKFFSHLNTNISTFNYSYEFANLENQLKQNVSDFSRSELSDSEAIETTTNYLSTLVRYKNISYLDHLTLINKCLIFLINIFTLNTQRSYVQEQKQQLTAQLNTVLDKIEDLNTQALAQTMLMMLNAETTRTKRAQKLDLTKSEQYNDIEIQLWAATQFKMNASKALTPLDYIQPNANKNLESSELLIKLCLEVSKHLRNNQKIATEEKRHINNAIAYLVTELLRAKCFEKYFAVKHFMCLPTEFAHNILTVLFYHSERVLNIHIPTAIKTRLFNSIKEIENSSLQIELAHLQHCIDIYIAGFHLFNQTNLMALFGIKQNVDINTKNSYQTFALAALCHDIGMLKGKQSAEYDPLTKSGILIKEEAEQLVDWFKGADHPIKQHTFGSANYLLHAAELENKLYDERFTIDKTNILTPALKSIVYHAAPQYSFNAKEQPACALLALLDELFEWAHSLDTKVHAGQPINAPLKLHLPVLPYHSNKSNIEYCDKSLTFTIKLTSSVASSCLHIELLRLAQMYGRFEFEEQTTANGDKQKNQFNIKVNLDKTQWDDVMSDIAQAALTSETPIKPLILNWTRKQRERSKRSKDCQYTELNYTKQPFANIDVKCFFEVIENYIHQKNLQLAAS